MRVLAARGDELERSYPYTVVRQLFEPMLVEADDAQREQLLIRPRARARTVETHLRSTDKMITIEQMYVKDTAVQPLEQILLMALVKDMNERNTTRLPILDDRRPLSIVHEATINKFMVQAMQQGGLQDLTPEDLLDRHADAREGSYAEVPRSKRPWRPWRRSRAVRTAMSHVTVSSSAGCPTWCSFRTEPSRAPAVSDAIARHGRLSQALYRLR